MQLDADDLLFSGDQAALKSYAYYGAPVHSVADGVVVNTYDEAAEEVPGQPRTDLTPQSIGGNMIVVDIGGGNFAFYAHLQRGSLKVKLGDKVTAGQELGLLGNTGNSDAPHLHFHVMDGPSPLASNGLPFVFRSFSTRGVLTDAGMDAIWAGKAAEIEPTMAGAHAAAMPQARLVGEHKAKSVALVADAAGNPAHADAIRADLARPGIAANPELRRLAQTLEAAIEALPAAQTAPCAVKIREIKAGKDLLFEDVEGVLADTATSEGDMTFKASRPRRENSPRRGRLRRAGPAVARRPVSRRRSAPHRTKDAHGPRLKSGQIRSHGLPYDSILTVLD